MRATITKERLTSSPEAGLAHHPKPELVNLMHHATKTYCRFPCGLSGRSIFDPLFPLSDLELFDRSYFRGAVDQAGSWLVVGELYCRFAPRLSLYQCSFACLLQSCRGLGRPIDFSFPGRGFLLDSFRSCLAGRAGGELPSDGGSPVRC